MKNILYAFMVLLTASPLCSCSDDDDALASVYPKARGTVTDDKGNVYGYVSIGGLDWTTTNALNGTPLPDATYFNGAMWTDLFTSDEKTEIRDVYMPAYGNLMTYDEAVASAPEGWRLPTDEDWQALERALGMKDTAARGWRGDGVASLLVQTGGGTELGLGYGGYVKVTPGQYVATFEYALDKVGEDGYYWTSTVDEGYTDMATAYFRHIMVANGSVAREAARGHCYMSVRWCRESGK